MSQIVDVVSNIVVEYINRQKMVCLPIRELYNLIITHYNIETIEELNTIGYDSILNTINNQTSTLDENDLTDPVLCVTTPVLNLIVEKVEQYCDMEDVFMFIEHETNIKSFDFVPINYENLENKNTVFLHFETPSIN